MLKPTSPAKEQISYNGKIFRSIENTENGEVNSDTIFHYSQDKNLLSATYEGGSIVKGFMIGLVNPDSSLNFSYQHVNDKGEICTGQCYSVPTVLPNGKIQLQEKWQWT